MQIFACEKGFPYGTEVDTHIEKGSKPSALGIITFLTEL